MRIVVLSDTHAPRFWKRCPPAVAEHLRTAEVILHAGDVCVASVLEELSAYAPVHAVVGNNDGPDVSAWGASETAELDLAGLRVGMIHDAGAEGGPADATSPPVPRDRPRRLRSLAYPAAGSRR